jgi:RNA polymerase sigma-70 factor (ECF subfamily)
MPPALAWFRGRPAVARCLAAQFLTAPGRLRLVPTMANGQVMFAVYQIAADGSYHAHAVIAPTIAAHGIARMVAFANPALFGSFGLPPVHGLPASGPAPA